MNTAYALTRAAQSEQVAREWMDYAKRLEEKLALCAAPVAASAANGGE